MYYRNFQSQLTNSPHADYCGNLQTINTNTKNQNGSGPTLVSMWLRYCIIDRWATTVLQMLWAHDTSYHQAILDLMVARSQLFRVSFWVFGALALYQQGSLGLLANKTKETNLQHQGLPSIV